MRKCHNSEIKTRIGRQKKDGRDSDKNKLEQSEILLWQQKFNSEVYHQSKSPKTCAGQVHCGEIMKMISMLMDDGRKPALDAEHQVWLAKLQEINFRQKY